MKNKFLLFMLLPLVLAVTACDKKYIKNSIYDITSNHIKQFDTLQKNNINIESSIKNIVSKFFNTSEITVSLTNTNVFVCVSLQKELSDTQLKKFKNSIESEIYDKYKNITSVAINTCINKINDLYDPNIIDNNIKLNTPYSSPLIKKLKPNI